MTTTPPPRYVRIADAIEARILSGHYQPGDQIPSYRDLMDGAAGTEHVSWATAAAAVALLVRKGLVEPGTNQGTRVREHPELLSRSQLGLGSDRMTWREAAAVVGMKGSQTVLGAGRQQAPPDVAIRLEMEPGTPVVFRRRLLLADDVPYQLADSYFPLDIAGGTALELPGRMRSNAVVVLESLGHLAVRFGEEVWSRLATEAEAETLRLRPGAPVLRVLRTCYSASRPVEVLEMICPGDRMSSRYAIDL
jgi:GntR family transcriptional regulator